MEIQTVKSNSKFFFSEKLDLFNNYFLHQVIKQFIFFFYLEKSLFANNFKFSYNIYHI